MALLLKESTDLLTTYHFQHYQSIPKVNQLKFVMTINSLLQFSPIDHHESAAKILFNAMNWPKTIPAFTALTNSDQVGSNESFALLDFLSLACSAVTIGRKLA